MTATTSPEQRICRYKRIMVSALVLQQIMTEGNRSKDWDAQCTQGLPADARLVFCDVQWGNRAPVIVMIFEHPEWPDVPEGELIPEFVPTFKQIDTTTEERPS